MQCVVAELTNRLAGYTQTSSVHVHVDCPVMQPIIITSVVALLYVTSWILNASLSATSTKFDNNGCYCSGKSYVLSYRAKLSLAAVLHHIRGSNATPDLCKALDLTVPYDGFFSRGTNIW